MGKQNQPSLTDYPYSATFSVRWADNDRYGHLNNAVYYQFYDALVNGYMMEHCNWDPRGTAGNESDNQIGLVVSSGTEYFEIVRGFPGPLVLGLGVKKLGKSSVEYEIGVFQDRMDKAKALGRFVHVFVDKETDKTSPNGMAPTLRQGLGKLVLKNDNITSGNNSGASRYKSKL